MYTVNNRVMISPCTSQCKLDENDICLGCYRSAAEIGGWRSKSEDEQIAITIRCKKKLARLLEGG
ncbi:MAG: DUF1289 domain-containing protein [Oceanospirillaceae bacterium]|nr:DUF1289 domain-containing protein [Oceanospirillaceae bacterium]